MTKRTAALMLGTLLVLGGCALVIATDYYVSYQLRGLTGWTSRP